jgi:hypothetical protein
LHCPTDSSTNSGTNPSTYVMANPSTNSSANASTNTTRSQLLVHVLQASIGTRPATV